MTVDGIELLQIGQGEYRCVRTQGQRKRRGQDLETSILGDPDLSLPK